MTAPRPKLSPEQVKAAEARLAERRRRVLETFQLDPLVPIKLKGKDYTLEFNNWAVKKVLKETGFNVMSTGFGMEQMQDPVVMGNLLFNGLLTNHPDLTQDDVDRMYSFRHYPYILECLRIGLDLFTPDMSDVETADNPIPEITQDPSSPQTVAG